MAHDGEADRDEVATNLRLEQHTEFEADAVAVDGTPYEEYLDSTMAYQFVDWLTEMALYEIRDTAEADDPTGGEFRSDRSGHIPSNEHGVGVRLGDCVCDCTGVVAEATERAVVVAADRDVRSDRTRLE